MFSIDLVSSKIKMKIEPRRYDAMSTKNRTWISKVSGQWSQCLGTIPSFRLPLKSHCSFILGFIERIATSLIQIRLCLDSEVVPRLRGAGDSWCFGNARFKKLSVLDDGLVY